MSYFEIMEKVFFWFSAVLWALALTVGSVGVLFYLVVSIVDRAKVFTSIVIVLAWVFLVLPGLVYLQGPLDNWAVSLGID